MSGSNEVRSPHDLGALELLKETLATTAQLADKQIQLLRAEVKETLREERRRLIAVGFGGGFAIGGFTMLATAGALALGFKIGHPELFVMGIGLFIGAASAVLLVLGIRKLEKPPSVATSIHIFEEEIEWAKGKLAETKSSSSPET